MTVVPLLILPFVTMIFWTLGGGKDSNIQDPDSEIGKGFNLNLPSAYFSDEKFNKLSLYQKVKRDSIRLIQQRKNDPYFDLSPISNYSSSTGKNQHLDHQPEILLENTSPLQEKTDPNEELVNKKLDELNKIVNRSHQEPSYSLVPDEPKKDDSQFASDVEKLEQMMIHMETSEGEQDPELVQLQGMINQILDIQHPERLRQKIKEQSLQEKKKAFPVHSISEKDLISLIEQPYSPTFIRNNDDSLDHKIHDKPLALYRNGFYGLEDGMETETGASNVIQAVVYETQELVNGSVIKLRLLNDVYIGGHLIPKENLIYGICQINMERLLISIPSIKHKQSLLPVALSVYDLDGLEGVYVPGIISRDVAKQAADQAVQSFSLDGFDPSLAAQATTVGINAAKALLSRKAKLVKVTVKAGYQVILTDHNS